MDAEGDLSAEEVHMDLASMMAQMKNFHNISALSQPRVSDIDFSLAAPPATPPPTSVAPPCTMSFCGMAFHGAAAVSPAYPHSPSTPPPYAAAMREVSYAAAAMQPVQHVATESSRPLRRRNVRVSKDPQSVAARCRRERISEKMWTLRRLVPGGTRMDTASMLEEAIRYLKFLKSQLQSLHGVAGGGGSVPVFLPPPPPPPPPPPVAGVYHPKFGTL